MHARGDIYETEEKQIMRGIVIQKLLVVVRAWVTDLGQARGLTTSYLMVRGLAHSCAYLGVHALEYMHPMQILTCCASLLTLSLETTSSRL